MIGFGQYRALGLEKIVMKTMSKEQDDNGPETLVKDVDYYVEEGKYVFTAAYHSKRGFCCENKCRHCPFDSEDKNKE